KSRSPHWLPARPQPCIFGPPPAAPPPPEAKTAWAPREDRPAIERPRPQSGMSSGLKVALIGGGAAVLLLVLCCGVIAVIVVAVGGQKSNERSWSLATDRHTSWTIPFKKGDQVTISVHSNSDSDVDLFVFASKANM